MTPDDLRPGDEYIAGRLAEIDGLEVDARARDNAATVIGVLRKRTPSVLPNSDGGIDFVWHCEGWDLEVSVSADGVDSWGRPVTTPDDLGSPRGGEHA